MGKVQVDVDIKELIPGFLQNLDKSLKEIESNISAGSFEAVKKACHTIKGAAGGYGFDRVSQIAGDMQGLAEAQKKDDLNSHLAEIRSYLGEIEIEYVEMD